MPSVLSTLYLFGACAVSAVLGDTVTCDHETIMTISMDRDFTVEDFDSILGYPNENFFRNDMGWDDDQIYAYLLESLPFFEQEYGVTFSSPENYNGAAGMLSDDGNFLLEAASISTSIGLPGPSLFRTLDSRLGPRNEVCEPVLDGGFAVVSLTGNGTWGGSWGARFGGGAPVPAKPFESVLYGRYVMRNSLYIGTNRDDCPRENGNGNNGRGNNGNGNQEHDCEGGRCAGQDLVLDYKSFAPMEGTPYGSVTLNCDVFNDVLGNGRMVGAFRAEPNPDGTLHMRDHQTIQLNVGATF